MYESNTVFSEQLLAWYNACFRQLPWRETKDPYPIWLSEVILQQTRVEQGTNYYFAFLERFPTILDLADAPQDEVLRLWQGLGYYSLFFFVRLPSRCALGSSSPRTASL